MERQTSQMSHPVGMARQLGLTALRVGWYVGIREFAERWVAKPDSPRPDVTIERPVPSLRELLSGIAELAMADARAVGRGDLPPQEAVGTPPRAYFRRLSAMLRDIPEASARRAARATATVRDVAPNWQHLPEYYTQDFHFQGGGHLTDNSARIYDVQVETLFSGSAALMRRAAMIPILAELRRHDQRRIELADVGCGTGRLLRELRLAFPALRIAGVDLSPAYLDEARRHLTGLRPVRLIAADAEKLPFADATQDIVTAVYLFHELPPEVRRRVAAEVARVLKPGGIFVFADSLQFGDRPGWDGLLEAFPQRFHEPYYRHYCIDDLDAAFDAVGLASETTEIAFLSKVMVRRKKP